MGFLDRFLRKAAPTTGDIFTYLLGKNAPNGKTMDYLAAYTGWVYAPAGASERSGPHGESSLSPR